MTEPRSFSPGTGFSVSERRTLLMGRASEMRALEDALAAVQKTGTSRTVTVLGASGVGKTRLVREFLVRLNSPGGSQPPSAPAPTRVFRGSAKDERVACGVFGRILRARFGVMEGMDDAAAKAQVRTQLTAVLDDRKVGDFGYFLGELLDLDFQDSPLIRAVADDPQQMHLLRRAVIKRFWEDDALLAGGPVSQGSGRRGGALVLVFEDLQGAMDESLDLLSMLIDGLRAPILIVCVARAELIVRRDGWLRQADGTLPHKETRHSVIDLSPLSESDAAAVMHDLLTPCGDDPAVVDLVDAACTLAGGNPALLEQMVRIFHDSGVLEQKDDTGDEEHWSVHPERLELVRLPLTVEDAVQARIAGLSPSERVMLERAATMGGVFWVGGLLAIHRQDDAAPELWDAKATTDALTIRQVLTTLVDKDYLLSLPDSTFPGDEEYVFKHNLEREALVKMTPSGARQRYHAVIADWLAFKENVASHEEYLSMLAMHREKSGARAPAARTYLLAADVARSHYANLKANEYYARGLALIREGATVEPDVRLAALHYHGDVLQSLGRHVEARAAFKEMLERSFRLDLRAKGGAAHARLGRLHRETGRLDEAEKHLGAALSLFEQMGDQRGIASTVDDIGKLHWLRGDYVKALDFAQRGLAMRRQLGDRRSIALSLNNLALVYQDSGQFKKALDSFEQALGIRREIADLVGVSQTLNNLGTVAQDQRDDARALVLFNEAYDTAKETGDRNRIAIILTNIGETHNRLGDGAKAISYLKQAEELADELGDKIGLAEALRGLGKAYLTLRELTRARECTAKALSLFREVESRVQVGVALRSLGEVMAAGAAGGETFAKAGEHILESIKTFEQIGNDIELARSCRAYGKLLLVSPQHAVDPRVAADAAAYLKRADDTVAKLTISARGLLPESFFSPT